MSMLAETGELVIGVDTHTDTHTAAVVTAATGALVDTITVSADPRTATTNCSPWPSVTAGYARSPSKAPEATAPA